MAKNERLKYVDIARGLAMFVIVLSHALSATTEQAFPIYRFLFFVNVPIFFVLSGYMFRIKENESFLQFFKKKFLRIMLPYFVWALVFLIPYLIFGSEIINQLSQKSSFDVWEQIGNVFYGNGVNNALKQNGPLWFLPALFATEVLFYFVVYFVKNKKAEVVTLLITVLIGFSCTFFAEKFYLPWGLNSALTIGCFFYFGYLLRKWQVFDKLRLKPSIFLLMMCIVLCGVSVWLNNPGNVVWADYQYQNYFLTILAGVTSSIVIIQLSKYINKNKVIEFVGTNTMGILIFHKIMIVVAQTKLGAFSKLLTDSNILFELCLALFASVVAIVVSILLSMIMRKIAPWLIGERKKPAILQK